MYFCKPEFGTCVQTNRYEMAERRHITICGKSWYSREYECPVCHRRFIRKVDAWWAETSPLRKYKRCKACEGVAVVRGRKPRKVAKGYKHCRYCQETKVLCLFHRDRSARDGRSGRCVACAKEKRKRYYAAHKDAEKKSAAAWGRKNRVKKNEANVRYRENVKPHLPTRSPKIKADARQFFAAMAMADAIRKH